MNYIPYEVLESLPQDINVPYGNIKFFRKDEMCKSDAWRQCPQPPKMASQAHNNPWRKIHSENFWAWYSIEGLKS